MASRDPKDLTPALQVLWAAMQAKCKAEGLDVFLTCTYRTNYEQEKLYAQGRTAPGHIVTFAKAGQSKHNKRPAEAFDIAILEHGKLNWNPRSEAWGKVGKIGVELGLDWAYNWKKFKECPHFELIK